VAELKTHDAEGGQQRMSDRGDLSGAAWIGVVLGVWMAVAWVVISEGRGVEECERAV